MLRIESRLLWLIVVCVGQASLLNWLKARLVLGVDHAKPWWLSRSKHMSPFFDVCRRLIQFLIFHDSLVIARRQPSMAVCEHRLSSVWIILHMINFGNNILQLRRSSGHVTWTDYFGLIEDASDAIVRGHEARHVFGESDLMGHWLLDDLSLAHWVWYVFNLELIDSAVYTKILISHSQVAQWYFHHWDCFCLFHLINRRALERVESFEIEWRSFRWWIW